MLHAHVGRCGKENWAANHGDAGMVTLALARTACAIVSGECRRRHKRAGFRRTRRPSPFASQSASGTLGEPEFGLQRLLPGIWCADPLHAVCHGCGVRPCRYRTQRRATSFTPHLLAFSQGLWQPRAPVTFATKPPRRWGDCSRELQIRGSTVEDRWLPS